LLELEPRRLRGGDAEVVDVGGQVINGKEIGTYNTFDSPYQVQLLNFKDAKYKNGTLTAKLPAHSLVTIELK
jgi:alpha-N-arabinofuranosidase